MNHSTLQRGMLHTAADFFYAHRPRTCAPPAADFKNGERPPGGRPSRPARASAFARGHRSHSSRPPHGTRGRPRRCAPRFPCTTRTLHSPGRPRVLSCTHSRRPPRRMPTTPTSHRRLRLRRLSPTRPPPTTKSRCSPAHHSPGLAVAPLNERVFWRAGEIRRAANPLHRASPLVAHLGRQQRCDRALLPVRSQPAQCLHCTAHMLSRPHGAWPCTHAVARGCSPPVCIGSAKGAPQLRQAWGAVWNGAQPVCRSPLSPPPPSWSRRPRGRCWRA